MKKKTKTKMLNELGRKIGAALIVASMIAGIAVPTVQTIPQASTVKKTKTVKLKGVSITGSSKTITVKSSSKVKWATSNKSVATVKSAGKSKAKVTAKKTGTATVTGKAGSKKWTVKVKVKKKGKKTAVKTVKLKAVSLTAGKSKTVTANTKSKVSWSSSNKAVVTVKSTAKNKAKVTAKKTGTATVTGKAGKTKWTAKVTVKKKSTNGSNTTKSTTTSTFNKTLLNSKIKVILHECGADTGTTDIQKFAKLCHWWNHNIEYGDDYPKGASKSITAKYGEADSNHSLSAAYIVEYKKGVCGTQAQAFGYFAKLIGLRTENVCESETFNHEWLHVYLDDGWYVFDPTWINNNNGHLTIDTFDEYLTGSDGQKEYQSWYKAALRHHPQEAEERARKATLEHFEKFNAYRIANYLPDEHGNAITDPARMNREYGTDMANVNYIGKDYYIDSYDGSFPISLSELNAQLNGKKYVNEFLYKYL